VGFLIADPPAACDAAPVPECPGVTAVRDLVRISGPGEHAIAATVAMAWVADSPDLAREAAPLLPGPVATLDGIVFRGSSVVEGGTRAEARGILATKREIKELRDGLERERAGVVRLRDDIAALDVTVAAAESAIASVQAELHRQEKAIVGFELQLSSAAEATDRLARKRDQIGVERRTAEEELRAQEARQHEARESIVRIESQQRAADERLNQVQRRLFDAREEMQLQARRTAEAKAAHAALMERAAALAVEVERLEAAGRELESRVSSRREELRRAEIRREQLRDGIRDAEAQLDEQVKQFDRLRQQVRASEERCQALRLTFDQHDGRIRDARRVLEFARAEVAQLDVARATAEADLTHLAASCVETVQATLDEVAGEVEQLEREGQLASPQPVDDAPEPTESESDVEPAGTPTPAPEERPESKRPLTADEMVADLRMKIDRMGPVNMMAIDQFDDLETRHAFLTTQRKDLVDSIAVTSEAIKKIDKTTRERFSEAFTVINRNFETTFTTLFGGGRAGLVLLDESDALESGIDIIAQPPGKRLQSVQLLSGGEKALTAMALMFAIFQYRPSPFCLLDEIDAPLDDANIGRFVEMLQGMQEDTQFILITHNRKTMEIADRLYGVTMEEPGVSKLISVQLN
jgi:chromosome segregation protein